MSERYLTPKFIATATALMLDISACGNSSEHVEAKIASPNASTLAVDLLDGRHVSLANNTAVSAVCIDGDPFTLRATINSGPYTNNTAIHIPRANLENTTDPFGAGEQQPPQDPFGPLAQCRQ